jgi:hypothetical protein
VAARLSMPFASLFYDAVYLMKAGVEATGKTDGATLATWIEENAKSFEGINKNLSPSKQSHFLVGVDAMTTVFPDRLGEGGIQLRTKC